MAKGTKSVSESPPGLEENKSLVPTPQSIFISIFQQGHFLEPSALAIDAHPIKTDPPDRQSFFQNLF